MQIAAIEGNGAVAYPKGTDKPTKRETLCDAEQQSGRIGSRIALLFRSFCLYGLTGIERCRAKQMIKYFTHLRDVFALRLMISRNLCFDVFERFGIGQFLQTALDRCFTSQT